MDKIENPPAFPYAGEAYENATGMTLRDWFAGRALEAIYHNGGRYGPDGMKQVAEYSYAMADAMLAARQGGDA